MKKAALLLLLAGCSYYSPEPGDAPEHRVNVGAYRFIDQELGIVCYTYYQRAISCVRLEGK